jgi:hypothetical protein
VGRFAAGEELNGDPSRLVADRVTVCASGCAGPIRSGMMPRRIHQTANRDNRTRPLPANGDPLSLRIRVGNPYAANARSKRRRVGANKGPDKASQRKT